VTPPALDAPATPPPLVRLRDVGFTRGGNDILDGVDWDLEPGSTWVLLGANGSGKTTLGRIVSLWEHPSRGQLEWRGRPWGTFDVRRARVETSFVSAAMVDLVRPTVQALDVVMTAKHAALEPWWHRWEPADRSRARDLLAGEGVADLAERPFGTLSSGERQRTLLARALMSEPDLVVLDEPAAGLDLGAREELVTRLDSLASDPAGPAVVLVTHHVEEVPPSFEHLVALRHGRVLTTGPLPDRLTSEMLTECFDVSVELRAEDTPGGGMRYSAVGSRADGPGEAGS